MSATLLPRLSLGISPDADPDQLAFARALGCECVYAWVRPEQRTAAYLGELRRRVEGYGLALYMVGSFDLGKSDKHPPGAARPRRRSARISRAFVRDLGQAGIHVTTFTWEPDRCGARRRASRAGPARATWTWPSCAAGPSPTGAPTASTRSGTISPTSCSGIMPVAEEAGVRLALHPNDPPHRAAGRHPLPDPQRRGLSAGVRDRRQPRRWAWSSAAAAGWRAARPLATCWRASADFRRRRAHPDRAFPQRQRHAARVHRDLSG